MTRGVLPCCLLVCEALWASSRSTMGSTNASVLPCPVLSRTAGTTDDKAYIVALLPAILDYYIIANNNDKLPPGPT